MTVAALPYKIPKRRGPVLQFIVPQPLGAAGLLVILAMIGSAAFADILAPFDPLDVDFSAMLGPPGLEHWLGTDAFGRDVLSRIMYGARTALAVGFLSSIFGCTAGAVLGVVSAYFGGKIDLAIQGVVDVLLSFPIIVLALVVVAVLPRIQIAGIDVALIGAIAIPMALRVARVTQASALAIRELPYVDAA